MVFPALKIAPPFENCMITGLFNSAAVSKTALMVLFPVTFTAGRAKDFALASLKTSCTCFPVMTPAGILNYIQLLFGAKVLNFLNLKWIIDSDIEDRLF